ncbi:PAS domain S-box protein [Aquimarina sp. AD10]|uniref:sensor histidine kinase n=1 Tax=Aquimarina sp. AD10 TaxID=1714849 RepID=UPI000E46777A|nr:ATP-binding protein [Aquimarina sp. AD10]AXT62724.1 PAS domain S-box protein [Aquimarina sp. AD10]RKN01907.1 PAS domain S-box protein [Aquimarina sp. AD10]
MSEELDILKRALKREKAARKQAEQILEGKSRELYDLTQELKQFNEQLEDGLTKKTSELQGVFDNLVDAYVLMDISGNVVKMNNSAKNLFGYDIDQEKLNIVTLIYKEDYQYAMTSFQELVTKGSFSDYQARVYTKDKGVRTVHINASLIRNKNHQPVAAQGIVRDITAQLELEQQREKLVIDLEKMNQELSDYAHIVSHDLKSPLRSIYALVNWIKEDYSSAFDKIGLGHLSMIEKTLEKMETLINDILSYSRAGNKDNLETKQIDLNTLISDIKNIILIPDNTKVYSKQELPVIHGDKTRIQQLFQNLIGNAVMYMDKEKGIIEIDYTDQKTHHLFIIKDNGPGIKEEYHKKIFKMFESVGNHKNSTGIGLAIVKKIVELYEGKIWLESSLDKGTTFYFTLKK